MVDSGGVYVKEWLARGLYGLYGVLSFIDLKQTEAAGIESEANPIVRALWNYKGLIKLLVFLFIAGASEWLIREGMVDYALQMNAAVNAIQGGIVIWNYMQLKQW